MCRSQIPLSAHLPTLVALRSLTTVKGSVKSHGSSANARVRGVRGGGKHTRHAMVPRSPLCLSHSECCAETKPKPVSARTRAVIASGVKGEGDRNCLRTSGSKKGGGFSPQTPWRMSAYTERN